MIVDSVGPEGRYHTRLLEPPDLRALQALFERATDYFEIVTGHPPGGDEAQRAFVAGPPTKQVSDKRVIGIFSDRSALVGVLDALTDWPQDGTWSMGVLLLDPAHRSRGLGSAMLAAYERWATTHGARVFRTAVVAHHEPAIRFLERAGYARESRVDDYDAGGTHPAVQFYEKPATATE